MSEQMVYKMEAAGHEESSPKRKYSKPDKRLQEAYVNFIRELDIMYPLKIFTDTEYNENYDTACRLVKSMQPTVDEICSFILSKMDDPALPQCGLFFSALYNKAKEKEFVYKLDIPFHYMASKLPKDKVFVNCGNLGHLAARESEGTFISLGTTRSNLGRTNKGIILNYGKTDFSSGSESQGLLFHFGQISDGFGWPKSGGLTVKYDTNDVLHENYGARHRSQKYHPPIKELWEYLKNLEEKLKPGKEDYKEALKVLKEFGDDPRKKIMQDITDFLQRGEDV